MCRFEWTGFTCGWIRQKNMTDVCGDSSKIRNLCPYTCDACVNTNREYEGCTDSSGKVLVGDENRTCKFILNNNMMEFCDDSSDVRDFCPLTCDACADEEEADEGCVNSKGKILVGDTNRTCKFLLNNNMMDVCDDSIEIRNFCPLTCNTCEETTIDEGCVNSKGKILIGGINRTCKFILNNNMMDVCDDSSEIRDFCPLTCNTCEETTIVDGEETTIVDGEETTIVDGEETTIVDGCVDSSGKILVGDINRTCMFLSQNNNMTDVCDDSSEIRDFCPLTCNTCEETTIVDGCVDSSGKILVGDIHRTCRFLSPNNITDVCDDSSEIRDFCPRTWGACYEEGTNVTGTKGTGIVLDKNQHGG